MARGPKKAQREARPGLVFPSEAVARNVRSYRGARGLKQSDLADLMSGLGLEWSAGTVGFVERYERSVTVDELVALALCFGVPLGHLVDPAGPLGTDGVGLDLSGGDDDLFIPHDQVHTWATDRKRLRYDGGRSFIVESARSDKEEDR
jgi:transcriptional regulator with XRE-family HTH domain